MRELEEIYAAFDIGPELDSVRRIFRADNMPLVIKALLRLYYGSIKALLRPELDSVRRIFRAHDMPLVIKVSLKALLGSIKALLRLF